MLNLTHLARTINSLIGGKILSKQNKMADLLFPLIDPQIRERKFQQREIDLDELTDEELRSRYRFGLIIFMCSVNFWLQQDSNSWFKRSIGRMTSSCKWPIFAPYFFRGRRTKNSLNRFSFSTNLGLVNRGIISLSGPPF